MGKKYHFDMPADQAAKLDKYIQQINPDNTSEVLRHIVMEKLNRTSFSEEPTGELAKLHAKVKNPDFLYEMFTCPITRDAMQVGALPCVQAILGDQPDFECHNHVCLGTLKRRLGIA